MARVVWRNRAKRQLRAITDYINARNPTAAISYAEGIRIACEGLSNFPEQGRRYNSTYRLIVYRNHVVFYTDRNSIVEISAVIDARRDIAAVLSALTGD